MPGNELKYVLQANKSFWISVLQFAEGVKNKPYSKGSDAN